MSIRQSAKNYLKDTANKVLVAVLTAGALAVLGILYANKNQYVGDVKDFIFSHWEQLAIAILLVGFVWLYMQVLKLAVPAPASTGDNSSETFLKAVTLLKESLNKTDARLKALELNARHDHDNLYGLRREHLYHKAQKHEKLGQRGALLCRLRVVELDIAEKSEYNLDESLDELYTHVKNTKDFGTQDLSDAKKALIAIHDDGHKVIVDEILSQIKSKLI